MNDEKTRNQQISNQQKTGENRRKGKGKGEESSDKYKSAEQKKEKKKKSFKRNNFFFCFLLDSHFKKTKYRIEFGVYSKYFDQ